MRVRIVLVSCALFLFFLISSVLAEIPAKISFQGKLTRPNGGPIADSLYQLTFRIYDTPTGGMVLWEELDTLTTRGGLFQTMLGGVNSIPQSVFIDTSAYLSVEFAGTELLPRKPFHSVGYAYHAAVADAAPPIPDADWTIDGDNIYHLNGNVGIGTENPLRKLHVMGNSMVLDNAGEDFGIFGASDDIEHNHYLSLFNSTGRSSAWGVKAGGLLVADSYTYANPGKNNLIVKGNVGIGLISPAYALDINGDARATNFRGNFIGTIDNALHWNGHSWGDTYPYSSNSDMVDGVHNGALTADVWDGHHWGDTYPYAGNTDMVDGIHGGSILRNDQSGTLMGNLGVGASPDARLTVDAPSGAGASIRNNSSSSVALWVSNNSTGTAISCGNQTSGADYVLKVIGYNNATNSNGMWVKGRTQIHGDFSASDGTKSAVVPSSQGMIKLYSQESPEVWFEDFGEGRLVNGQDIIALDPLFLETITVDDLHPMKVFIQLNDDCNGVFVQRGNTSFTVIELLNGNSSARFSYRVVAKRKGYENSRLEHETEWNQQ